MNIGNNYKKNAPTILKSNFFFICFFVILSSTISSQEIIRKEVYNYARKIVDTMASESMHGRGYVNSGDSIAANYLKTEFQKIGLEKFTPNYYQFFNFSINTFPEKVEFSFDGFNNNSGYQIYHGAPGKDFIIDASSPFISKNFTNSNLKVFDSTHATSNKKLKQFSKKISSNDLIIIDDRNVSDKIKLEYFKKMRNNPTKAFGTIELKKKLTWSQSQKVSTQLKIEVLEENFKFQDYIKSFGSGNINIQNKFIPNYQTKNVIGYIKGAVYPDSFIIFSAHYDHLGQMGESVYFPGANDNASGCAMLLNLAKHYSKPENKPKYSIAFIAFAGEEVGLMGSKFYTENPLFPLEKIKFVFNMDIMGTGEEGITVVNGAVFKKDFEQLKKINTENNFVKDVKIRGKAANSDHYYFSEKGIKAFFIYAMGGIKAYHDIYDRPETLPLNEFENLFKLITNFGDYLQDN